MTGDLTAQQRVIWLIKTLDDARVDWDGRSSGDGVILMPSGYHQGSYAELERVLGVMRVERRSQHWHVLERYRRGEKQTIEVAVVKRLRGPELKLPAHCELASGQANIKTGTARVSVYRWNPAVDMGKVRDGVNWLTRSMYGGRRARIQLPDDVYRRALGLEPREQRRERPVASVAA